MRLGHAFYARDTRKVARDLLGKTLCHRQDDGRVIRGRIVETEAYHGPDDRASHARFGPTPRAGIMFGPPGRAYVYLIYGMHHCLNVVTGADGFPAAVLLRGVDRVTVGGEAAGSDAGGRPGDGAAPNAIGPGRLTKVFGIRRETHNGLDLTDPGSELWIEDGARRRRGKVVTSPRVGVDYAGAWARRPWRYRLADAA